MYRSAEVVAHGAVFPHFLGRDAVAFGPEADDGAVVAGKIAESSDSSWGFNAQTATYEDLVKAGIIDPTKVVRTALQDAASVAGLLITTEAMVAERPEKPGAGGGMPGGMDPMGGMGGMGGMDF